MLTCFTTEDGTSRPAHVVAEARFADWRDRQPAPIRAWLDATRFTARAGASCLLPMTDGVEALLIAGDRPSPWEVAALHGTVGAGSWRLVDPEGVLDANEAAMGWALAAYRFDRYRKSDEAAGRPLLVLDENASNARGRALAEAHYIARDLINTPANDLGPAELSAAAEKVAAEFGASCRIIAGDELLALNYPLIHTVGQGSPRSPRLVDMSWGDPAAPKLTLVGKGVCFDTGGLDLKPSAGMLYMKKDMGGAALMLGLARTVMALGLPVRLRLLIATVENSVSGSAFRPLDVIRSRKGITVEIGNTDAEGRLILADALTEADGEEPALLLDAATLTGAARVALGPDVPGLFTPDDALAADFAAASATTGDLLWRLPLYAPYRQLLKSQVADINNVGTKPLGGAITAALFLQDFVTATRAWAHIDTYAWNDESRPGRPRGGEALGLRTLLALVEQRFGAA